MVNTKITPLLTSIALMIAAAPASASDMIRYNDPTVYYVAGFLALCIAIVLVQFIVAFIDHFTARRSMEDIIAEAQTKQAELQKMIVGVSISKAYSDKEESK